MGDSERIGCVIGAIVQAMEGRDDDVRRCLRRTVGVEIHEQESGGRFVVTIEADTGAEAIGRLERVQSAPSVLQVVLAYQYCDEHEEGGWQWR